MKNTPDHRLLAPQIIVDCVVTRALQVIRQIRARIIDRRANQILNVLLFGYHAKIIPKQSTS